MDNHRRLIYTEGMYLHERDNGVSFRWDESRILPLLGDARFSQGRLLGELESLGFEYLDEIESETLVSEVIASSRIEGIALDAGKVRSSVCRQLGLEQGDPLPDTHDVEGAVDILMDATRGFAEPLSHERLFVWHAALFPTGRSGLQRIRVAQYRDTGMQVVSGPMGKEKVHYEAPAPELVSGMMDAFIAWFNDATNEEPLTKAGIAHLWFVTIHPFDDGNGRIARALTECLLARSDRSPRRFYNMAEQILATRKKYYDVLEMTQKGDGDITEWLIWFLQTLGKALDQSRERLRGVLDRAGFWQVLEGVFLNVRQREMLNKLKSGFEGKLTTGKWAKICKVSADTALRDIKDLVDKGILEQDAGGGRSTSYHLTL